MRRTVDDAIAYANCGLIEHRPVVVVADSAGVPRQVKCRCGATVWEVPPAAELVRVRALARILSDLDRCKHGRHRIDSCLSCPTGQSTGNLFMPPPGHQVGVDLAGKPYFMPSGDRDDQPSSTDDPAAWRTTVRPAPAKMWKPVDPSEDSEPSGDVGVAR